MDKRSKTLSKSLANCNSVSMPNVFTLLKLFATLPLSSCTCERSASVIRRLNNIMRCTQTEERLTALTLIHMNYETKICVRRLNNIMRCTQTEERLTALTLIHMNYETKICVDEVYRKFFEKHYHRMEKANLLFNN